MKKIALIALTLMVSMQSHAIITTAAVAVGATLGTARLLLSEGMSATQAGQIADFLNSNQDEAEPNSFPRKVADGMRNKGVRGTDRQVLKVYLKALEAKQ